MSSAESLPGRLDGLAPASLEALFGKSMLLTSDWELDELETLCTLAEWFEDADRAGVSTALFPNELHLAVFFDASTRTKSSWAGAASRLGARPMVVDGSSTQVSHGETAEETGAMLGMNAHALGFRHDLVLGAGNTFMRGALAGIRQYLEASGSERRVPVVNLQCDIDHPTQSLADLCWLRERFPDGLAGKKVAVSWAYSPSYAKPLSVPQGLITLLPRFGAEVVLAHPEGYDLMPETLGQAERFASSAGGSFSVVGSMTEAFENADVVYPKSWGPYDLMSERVAAYESGDETAMQDIERRALERNARFTDWICDENLMKRTRDALYMHCLPADIGAEVSSEVLERFRFDLAREANKKVYAVMALLASAKEADLIGRLRECLQEIER